ncbi:hypothetical protein C2845_PM03G29010 [Panicum miliaceum]|uniref:Uncharacterized protein n=1 Tax=Panicum miliaceum TaxID=4540 RepID=A0A3L6TEL6_PANMI|nr:hypothetical protein C2845_PM03G29010 [Panicum miliaceum]
MRYSNNGDEVSSRVSGEVLARGKPSTLVGRQASDYSVHVVSPPVLSPCNTVGNNSELLL